MKKKDEKKATEGTDEFERSATEPVEEEFKGNPILNLPLDNGSNFRFGIGKARAIVEHIEAVKAFVKKYDE